MKQAKFVMLLAFCCLVLDGYAVADQRGAGPQAGGKPPFEWDAAYATPGTSLTVHEVGRLPPPSSPLGGTLVLFDVKSIGFSPDQNATLWRKEAAAFSKISATIDESGVVRGLGSDSWGVGGLVRGQAFDIALVSGDKRAHAKTIPFPIEVQAGDCSGSVEIMSGSGLLFMVTFRGLLPGEEVQVLSQFKREQNSTKLVVPKSGKVDFPVLFGKGDRGTATATATSASCAVSVQYKVGKDALVVQ